MQPRAVCSHIFSGVIWHCATEINSVQLHDSFVMVTLESISLHLHYIYITYLKFIFFTNILFQAQNTPLQNCIPSLGSFPSPWTLYPDFDSCYSHFMPYRMTPSVRHRAIKVHYYYYYFKYNEDNYEVWLNITMRYRVGRWVKNGRFWRYVIMQCPLTTAVSDGRVLATKSMQLQ